MNPHSLLDVFIAAGNVLADIQAYLVNTFGERLVTDTVTGWGVYNTAPEYVACGLFKCMRIAGGLESQQIVSLFKLETGLL